MLLCLFCLHTRDDESDGIGCLRPLRKRGRNGGALRLLGSVVGHHGAGGAEELRKSRESMTLEFIRYDHIRPNVPLALVSMDPAVLGNRRCDCEDHLTLHM